MRGTRALTVSSERQLIRSSASATMCRVYISAPYIVVEMRSSSAVFLGGALNVICVRLIPGVWVTGGQFPLGRRRFGSCEGRPRAAFLHRARPVRAGSGYAPVWRVG
ncbi:hypothetical protein PENSPDRAFT_503619 [Peniophora sp. CONT]|nr:hypothetical protein PENSPDRAFT_503619 [Peniophora sp. CONT]